MQGTGTAPQAGRNHGISRMVLTIIRILISSYFLASAAALYLNPSLGTPLDGLVGPDMGLVVTTFWVFATGFAVLLGVMVRPMALLMAVFVIGTGALQIIPGASADALAAYISEVALLGTLLLITLTQPGGSARFRVATATQAPRRITVAPSMVTRNGVQVAAKDDEVENIFADLWERPAVKAIA